MRYTSHPNVLLTELQDGTGVLLHLDTKFYFALNRTGMVTWRVIEKGATLEDVSASLVERFEIDEPRARRDVEALLHELGAEDLIERK
jgi:hypothetical protein